MARRGPTLSESCYGQASLGMGRVLGSCAGEWRTGGFRPISVRVGGDSAFLGKGEEGSQTASGKVRGGSDRTK